MLEAMARVAPSQPNEAMARIALSEMVPFHSTQALASKFPSKIFWTRFEIVLEGPNRFKRGSGSAVPEKG
jgi:hypothetical protein